MKRIRGGSGLGDSLYVRPIVDHLLRTDDVTVLSDWPDVFLGTKARVEPFTRTRIDVLAHYTQGKNNPTTTQWDDVCRSAGVAVPLRFDWTVKNQALIDDLLAKAAGRPIVVVHGGRAPMGRTDGFGAELLPCRPAFEQVLAQLADCYLVRIGKGEQIYPLSVGVDLNGDTSVAELLDVASVCAGIVGQCSFIVPMAEVFDKPLLVVWAAKGLASSQQYIKTIVPQKILSKPTSCFVMDDWPAAKIQESVRAFHNF